MSVFGNIIEGKVSAEFTIIEDRIDCTGRPLLLAFIKQLINSHGYVHLFCLDSTTPLLLASYGLHERVTCHSMFEDPADWDSSSDLTNPIKLHYHTDLVQYLNKCNSNQSNFAVVIDSLSRLILNNDLSRLCRTLQNLVNNSLSGKIKSRLIGLIHQDCHDDHTLKSLAHMASCIIELQSKELNSSEYLASVIHKSVGGKVTREKIQFTISDSLGINSRIMRETSNLMSANSHREVHQLATKLTFSVSLKNEEKQSRAQLVLPHEKIGQEEHTASTAGQIIYEPDEADDFDEEDPDDDLNI